MRAMSSSSWISRMLVLALAAAPAVAQAQSLPKGYASDESPTAPAATATASATVAAPTMKPTAVDTDATASATAQISTSADEYADTDPSALTDFQEPLQGYGSWVVDPTYGTVWVPDSALVGSDFAPYQSGGYWSMTDEGEWLWVSTYDWGYIPFHYGRWVWISGYGWSWIPGRTYAPAWVTWRVSDYGYIGWAPLPPTYYWSGGAAVYFTTSWPAAYVFCPTAYVFQTHVHTYIVRDKATVKSVAAHSRNYKPANPSAGSVGQKDAGSGSSAKAGAGSASKIQRPSGPSLKEAGIAEAAAPKKRQAADSRAQMFSKKSTTPKAKALVKSQRTASLGSTGNTSRSARTGSAATATTPDPISRSAGSFRRSGPAASAGRGSVSAAATSPASRAQGGVLRTPSSSGAVPSSRGSAAVSRGVSQPAARPSVSAPRASAPSASRASTPSVSRSSTPSVSRASSPSPSRASSPSRSSSPSPSRGSSSPSRSGGRR